MKRILDKYGKRPSIFFAASCLSCIVVVAFALVLAGCMPPNIVMRYEPTASAVPLGIETRPKVFLERIEDRTGGAAVSFAKSSGKADGDGRNSRRALAAQDRDDIARAVSSRARSRARIIMSRDGYLSRGDGVVRSA